jgi:hypothetical protein
MALPKIKTAKCGFVFLCANHIRNAIYNHKARHKQEQ